MRNLAPSSAPSSNTGSAEPRARRSAAAAARYSGRARRRGGGRTTLTPEDQDVGKRGPGAPGSKSPPRKRPLRARRTSSSSPRRPRRCSRYLALGSGGTKRSPSSRLSERAGSKMALRRPRPPPPRQDSGAGPSTAGQKAPPTAAQAPGSGPACSPGSLAARPRLNPSRLRSTPRAWAGGLISTCRMRLPAGAVLMLAISELVAAGAMRRWALRAPSGMLKRMRGPIWNRSSAKSTPPYTPRPAGPPAARTSPPSTRTRG
mmetsp:Transcript_117381/g.332580  ORF Transcript_117381/g.332580 Transcript_117381/m.332580 type:complete len:260 (+) Transcript_117381:77-856(+)